MIVLEFSLIAIVDRFGIDRRARGGDLRRAGGASAGRDLLLVVAAPLARVAIVRLRRCADHLRERRRLERARQRREGA